MVRLDLGLSASQLSEVFDSIDEDKSGSIDYAELAAALWHGFGEA
jgi:Ca2+-binding EF-hand superfamily protein